MLKVVADEVRQGADPFIRVAELRFGELGGLEFFHELYYGSCGRGASVAQGAFRCRHQSSGA